METVSTPEDTVLVVLMERDGDSVFSALAHQLHGGNVSSPKHITQTFSLRRETVQHLRDNSQDYWQQLLHSVNQRPHRYKHQWLEKSKVKEFLDDLSSRRFHAGLESVSAVADMMAVNVMVYVEKIGKFRVSSVENDVSQELAIAQRWLRETGCEVCDYYDSVIRVISTTNSP